MDEATDLIVVRYGAVRRLLPRPKSFKEAIQTVQEQFKCNFALLFDARLKVAGENTLTEQQPVTKTNWTAVAPQISVLLVRQAPPSEIKKEKKPDTPTQGKKAHTKTIVLSPKARVLGTKLVEPKIPVAIRLNDGRTFKKRFSVRLSKPLASIFAEFAELVGEDRKELRFHSNGQRLDDKSTLKSFNPRLGRNEEARITAAKVLCVTLRGRKTTMNFKLKSTERFRVLEESWAKALGLKVGKSSLRYKGHVLQSEDKPYHYGMDTGDVIDVVR
ncbi:hypothetical protein FRB90_010451 [Tulasnella sp. 427]|nr:hypothetical protein FRB90_010451 [Tulasnella sp. 427]